MFVEFISGSANVELKGQAPVSVTGQSFPYVDGPKNEIRGKYILTNTRGYEGMPQRNTKIFIDESTKYEIRKSIDTGNIINTKTVEETDEEIIGRLRKRFEILDSMTKAAKKGKIRAMIVSGPPGVGKSHGVESVLRKGDILTTLADAPPKYTFVKGAASAIGLYMKLFKYRTKDSILVFDDCDSVFSDEVSLNIMKAALDSKPVRTIHWNTDSRLLRQEDVPDHFNFEGSVIFITNLKFDHVKSKKLRDHLEALESRCHFVDLTIDTAHEKMLRIEQLVQDGMLKDYGLSEQAQVDVTDYIRANTHKLRELSVRTVIKAAELADAFGDSWRDFANTSLLKRG
jgi:hypothetical protein